MKKLEKMLPEMFIQTGRLYTLVIGLVEYCRFTAEVGPKHIQDRLVKDFGKVHNLLWKTIFNYNLIDRRYLSFLRKGCILQL